MKKKSVKYLWLTLFLSLLPMLIILLPSSLLHTHDGLVHLPRMAAWFKALKDGQFPPRWAGDLNYGYGMPVLIFMYPWPYFLSAIFLSLGLGLVWSFKLVISLGFLLSGIFMFVFSQHFFKDERKALLITVLYQFASFHLIEIIARGAFGETWTYAFVPLAMLGLIKIFTPHSKGARFVGKKISGFLTAALATGLLILTHNSISLSFFGVLVLFVFVFGKNLINYLWGLASLGLGLGLAAFYWLPALWERKYTYGDLFMKGMYLEHFPTFKQFFLPNLFNQDFGRLHNIPVQIGLFHFLSLVLAIFFLIKKKLGKTEKKTVVFSLIIFLTALFLMQPISVPLWEKLALLRQFQFSWRLLSLMVLATALTGFSLLKGVLIKGRVFWLLIGLIVCLSLSYWLPPEGFDQINEADYWHFPLTTTYFGETDVIWSAGPASEYPEKRVEIIGGEGIVKVLEKKSTTHKLQVSAETAVNIVDRTQFFPGWRVFVSARDGPASDWEEIPIQFQDPNQRGLITFAVPPGEHQVLVSFGRTKDRTIAEGISLASLAFLVLTSVTFKFKKVKQ